MTQEILFFVAGAIMGALLPLFSLYIVAKRNQNLRRQLFDLLNPDAKTNFFDRN